MVVKLRDGRKVPSQHWRIRAIVGVVTIACNLAGGMCSAILNTRCRARVSPACDLAATDAENPLLPLPPSTFHLPPSSFTPVPLLSPSPAGDSPALIRPIGRGRRFPFHILIKLDNIALFYRGVVGDYNIPGGCVLAGSDCPNPNVTFWLYTRDIRNSPHELDVSDPESIESAMFLPDLPIVILIHGYTGHRDYSPNPELRPAYFERGDINIITVDYMPLARDPCYVTAVLNVPTIGKCAAQLIDELVIRKDIALERFHVIGFSLGAQVSGEIGNHLQVGKLDRITGLDPAMPLFSNPNHRQKLDKNDAKFVDIVHTDALEKGKLEATGHADFYMNGGMQQPGCTGRDNMSRSGCNHWRAVLYYAESINSNIGFFGMKCSSWIYYMLGWCTTDNSTEEMIMGEYTPNTAQGLYFVNTNSESPYAQGRVSEQNHSSEARFSYLDVDSNEQLNDLE
ncbi:pancreatic lipase-related protein 2-like [Arctopsyche grandis]|uniref:pancreatic lipase-related protein 2-like n=1 Tax=Arctopsyche grandis TaxID=121162 RepID=UPI00406D893E